jgi:hypothetical protein
VERPRGCYAPELFSGCAKRCFRNEDWCITSHNDFLARQTYADFLATARQSGTAQTPSSPSYLCTLHASPALPRSPACPTRLLPHHAHWMHYTPHPSSPPCPHCSPGPGEPARYAPIKRCTSMAVRRQGRSPSQESQRAMPPSSAAPELPSQGRGRGRGPPLSFSPGDIASYLQRDSARVRFVLP